ncbi:hypothetical protein [Actinokineospora bangkokensis]|uniref:Uncharacterized protein n=1 Tax=Actinokineospora bangkokensis TaxID=1193682 RepID=A0A1Q9LM42_9PSEU|nr:hypothetical protein [Actinokineospora bangkokensis]OLR93063.1 hypothetical protein BJP25_19115 [Actinokineospora bangkokensis]
MSTRPHGPTGRAGTRVTAGLDPVTDLALRTHLAMALHLPLGRYLRVERLPVPRAEAEVAP